MKRKLLFLILILLFVDCIYGQRYQERGLSLTHTVVHLDAKSNFLTRGKYRTVFEVIDLQNATQWFYAFSIRSNDANEIKINLRGYIGSHLGQSISLTGLSLPIGKDYCNVYLMDKENSEKFMQNKRFFYINAYSFMNVSEGKIGIRREIENYYIGVENPNKVWGFDVVMEAVAVDEILEK
jgi:hypothetical protein